MSDSSKESQEDSEGMQDKVEVEICDSGSDKHGEKEKSIADDGEITSCHENIVTDKEQGVSQGGSYKGTKDSQEIKSEVDITQNLEPVKADKPFEVQHDAEAYHTANERSFKQPNTQKYMSHDEGRVPEDVRNEGYKLTQGVLKVHSSLQEESIKPAEELNTPQRVFNAGPVSTVLSQVIDKHSKAMMARSIRDTYDVISRKEVQNLVDWENIQKSCLSEIPPIDPGALHDLERRAKDVAGNLDHMLGTLATSLKSMSVVGVQCVNTYGTCVDNVGGTVDASIKSMYSLIAKCEELNSSMGPLYRMAAQIKDIKRTLDVLESVCR